MDLSWVNSDLLTEILLSLPAKSLIRFKLVCKKWLDLISSNYLCHQHTLRHPTLQQSFIIQAHEFYYFSQTTNGKGVMIPYTPSIPDHHKIVQECNGLLLLEIDPFGDTELDEITQAVKRHFRLSYYVYNPTTRQSRKITLAKNNNFPYVAAINLAFDHSKSPYYKIVCFRYMLQPDSEPEPSRYTYQLEVYDSESHTWELALEASFLHPGIRDGIYCDNAIYWKNHDALWRYDMAKNELKTLPLSPQSPRQYARRRRRRSLVYSYLQESNGHLYQFKLFRDDLFETIEVWELGGDGCRRWLLRQNLRICRDSIGLRIHVRLMLGDERRRIVSYENSPPRIMAHNSLDKSFEPLVDLERRRPMPSHLISGFRFGEILALV